MEKHNLSRTKIYNTWISMKDRCFNKNNRNYKNYGGRGITVCDEWRKSFLTFYNDMGKRPSEKSLDRIDNNGNYCKNNCRWATPKEQNRNTRRNKKIEAFGKIKTIVEWSEEFNFSRRFLTNLVKKGLDLEIALLNKRFGKVKYPKKKYTSCPAFIDKAHEEKLRAIFGEQYEFWEYIREKTAKANIKS
jgi:hypothetical protein